MVVSGPGCRRHDISEETRELYPGTVSGFRSGLLRRPYSDLLLIWLYAHWCLRRLGSLLPTWFHFGSYHQQGWANARTKDPYLKAWCHFSSHLYLRTFWQSSLSWFRMDSLHAVCKACSADEWLMERAGGVRGAACDVVWPWCGCSRKQCLLLIHVKVVDKLVKKTRSRNSSLL